MNERELDLTEAQKAIRSKYPPITRKYECKWNQLQSIPHVSCISSDEHKQNVLKRNVNVLKTMSFIHKSHI